MKKFLFGLLLTCSLVSQGQVFNNEWIDYSKTYYKFNVGKNGLYRIPQSALSATGLGSTPAEYFQLWRNGVQVPIYTSVATGSLSSSGYIEFWGKMNDGKPDNELYRNPTWQLNDKWSLESDTAAYFLTVDPNVSNNLRLETTANNVAGNFLPVEQYFMYTAGNYFRKRLNLGYAVNVGEYLYSSSYDKGEGWSSDEILTSFSGSSPSYGQLQFVFKNLHAYPGGPDPLFKIATSGNAINSRQFLAKVNSDSVLSNNVDFFNFSVDSTIFPLSLLNSSNDTVTVFNKTFCASTTCPVGDRMVVHKCEITYPRTFHFGDTTNFEFTLPANSIGNYLEITNFTYGATAPVLYDLTNGKRYIADISAAPMLKFVLEASMSDRELVLVSQDNSNVRVVSTLQTRNFIDYTATANQGDYLLISNRMLFSGPNGTNPIEEYRAYRSSAAGGSYTAKTYLADELIDQFGFGIKYNPAGIRNFIRYARLKYSIRPRQVFIIGRGVNYTNEVAIDNLVSNPASPDYASVLDQKTNLPKLDLVPTYGWPASDVLLTAEPGSSLPEISVGRLSVINGGEVAIYLKKIKEYELAQATSSPYVRDKAWMKNVVHIVGASEAGLESILSNYMDSYSNIITDTLFGAHVEKFSKSSSNAIETLNSTRLTNLFNEGITLITYFGHSSTTTLEFNLDNPENYGNFGKYPMFLGLGCNAGDFFRYSPLRLQVKETLSEKYVLSPDRGTIGFVASTHFGIVHYLDIWASRAYTEMSSKSYGKTMGEIMKATAEDVFNFTTQEDFYARCNTEQSALHGDPAILLNPHAKPDYVVEDQMVKISPTPVSVADSFFTVEAAFLNLGKAPDKNIVLEIKRELADGKVSVIRDTVPGIRFTDTMLVKIPINPTTDKGINKITVTVDPDGEVDELYESNNSITKTITIYEDEARPVYPYSYSIINKQNIKFIASTANPFAGSRQYKMEIDTTELFNSPFKVSTSVTSVGGAMEFEPSVSFTDSTVYYWRVAPVPVTG
ncbi:MAG: C25 family cysteine peptidase, partial [Flavisolibacter sp.]